MPDSAPSPLMRLATASLGLAALVYASFAVAHGRFDFGAMYGGSSIDVEGSLAYLAAGAAGLFGLGAVTLSVRGADTPRWVALSALGGAVVFAALWLVTTAAALVR